MRMGWLLLERCSGFVATSTPPPRRESGNEPATRQARADFFPGRGAAAGRGSSLRWPDNHPKIIVIFRPRFPGGTAPMASDGSITKCIELLKAGDHAAAEVIWSAYF